MPRIISHNLGKFLIGLGQEVFKEFTEEFLKQKQLSFNHLYLE